MSNHTDAYVFQVLQQKNNVVFGVISNENPSLPQWALVRRGMLLSFSRGLLPSVVTSEVSVVTKIMSLPSLMQLPSPSLSLVLQGLDLERIIVQFSCFKDEDMEA